MLGKLPQDPDSIGVEKGIIILKHGGVIAYPTDTVYGLGASALITHAVSRIFQIKKRPKDMALPLLFSDVSQIDRFVKSPSPLARFLFGKFFPGALTVVLYKSDIVSDIVTAGSEKVGVRIPNHPIPLALISGLGAPITGTSANLTGMPSPLTAQDVASQIGRQVDLIIDGGRAPGGVESTIVDVTLEKPLILREGAIPHEVLEKECAQAGFRIEFDIKKT